MSTLVLKWMLSFEEEKVKAHFICQDLVEASTKLRF
jgi:hypothetical protein